MKSSIFQITNSKIWTISALKVFLKLNQTVVLITFSTHDKPSWNVQKILIKSRDIQLQNFQGRNPSNFWVGNLENRCLHKFVLTLSDLYLSEDLILATCSMWQALQIPTNVIDYSIAKAITTLESSHALIWWKKVSKVESIHLNSSLYVCKYVP